jgi:hypothetical protein
MMDSRKRLVAACFEQQLYPRRRDEVIAAHLPRGLLEEGAVPEHPGSLEEFPGSGRYFRITTNRMRTDHHVPLNSLPRRFDAPFSG